jgi:hypothetical protein
MNELVGPFKGHVESIARSRRPIRVIAVDALGPLTILAGIVWAFAQPYRIVFLRDADKGLWDYLGQPPLLVVLVGLLFAVFVAPGLVEDMAEAGQEEEGDGAAR